jgi:hypothetical protein
LKAAVVKNIGGFDTSIQYGEDKDFLLKLKDQYEFAFIEKPLVYYREHNSNQSKIVSENALDKIFSDRIKIIYKHTQAKDNLDKQLVTSVINRMLTTAASWCFFYGKWKKGMDYLNQIEDEIGLAIKQDLPPKIAHVAVVKFNKQEESPNNNIHEFIDTFLQGIEKMSNPLQLKIPINKTKGLFFQEVFTTKNKIQKYSVPYFILLIVKYWPKLMKFNIVQSFLNFNR